MLGDAASASQREEEEEREGREVPLRLQSCPTGICPRERIHLRRHNCQQQESLRGLHDAYLTIHSMPIFKKHAGWPESQNIEHFATNRQLHTDTGTANLLISPPDAAPMYSYIFLDLVIYAAPSFRISYRC